MLRLRILFAALALAALSVGWALQPIIHPPAAVIRPVDQPRCFPPGTLNTGAFPMCPDSLPSMRTA